MVKLIRQFQKPILIFVVIVVIISFVVFLNMPGGKYGGGRSETVALVYGEPYTIVQQRKAYNRLEIVKILQMRDLLFSLGGRELFFSMLTGQEANDSTKLNFIWNSVILRHEADQLGIMATEGEIEKSIKELPPFQTNGAFDYTHYAQFTQNWLSPHGLTEADFEEVIGDQIRLAKLQALLGATVPAAASEVREQYVQRYQQTELSLVRLNLEDFKAAVQVSDDDVAKLFEARKESLKTPEKRKVKLVTFPIGGDKPLSGPERARASEEVSRNAQNFAVAMTEKDANLEALAAKMKLTVSETPLFAESDPPAELGKSSQAAQAAFRLTPAQPNSDVVGSDNAFYVMQLSGTEPARPLTLEEARPQLVEQLKQERAQEALNLKAAEWRKKIAADLQAGKSFDEAAKAAGATPEKFPAFSAADPKRDQPDAALVKQQAAEMAEGQLSEFLPTAKGGLVLHIDRRLPIDETAFAKEKPKLQEQLQQQKGEEVFEDWLRNRRTVAKIQVARG